MMAPEKIYIDCTETINSGLKTGIQRVVNNVINRSEYLTKEFGIEIVPVAVVMGTLAFQHLKDIHIKQPNESNLTISVISRIKLAIKLRLKDLIFRGFNSKISWIRVSTVFLKEILYFSRDIYHKIRNTYLLLKTRLSGKKLISVAFTKNDILLMLDSFWMYDALTTLETLAGERPFVVTVCYDLIPIDYPQYCDSGFVHNFRELFPRILKVSDGLIGISKSVQNAAEKYVIGNIPNWKNGQFEYFYLGSDFCVNNKSSEKVNLPEISLLLNTKESFFLAVGTIEPRKGYLYLLEGFELLWQEGIRSQLVIVGKVGWLCGDVLNEVEHLKRAGYPIHMLHNVDDELLDILYRQCDAVIFPSFVEGFGLPLVEALARNKPVLVSEIEAFKEIGKDAISYFKVGDPESLSQCVKEYLNTSAQKVESSHVDVTEYAISWDQSSRMLIEKSIKIFSSANATS